MPNRTICEVLQEMRSCYNTRNFAGLLGLVEEAQSMANKMEAGLQDKHNVEELREEKKDLKKDLKLLEAQIATLENSKDRLVNSLLEMGEEVDDE